MSGPKEILTHAQRVCRLYKVSFLDYKSRVLLIGGKGRKRGGTGNSFSISFSWGAHTLGWNSFSGLFCRISQSVGRDAVAFFCKEVTVKCTKFGNEP